jgi:hypothetical protein
MGTIIVKATWRLKLSEKGIFAPYETFRTGNRIS